MLVPIQMWPSRLGLQNVTTTSPPRGKTPTTSDLDMALDNLRVRLRNARVRGNAENPFIPIAPESTLAQSCNI